MIQKVALALFLLITAGLIALLAIAGARPGTFHVERSADTSASPQAVYAVLSDLNRYPKWSPWQKLDPAMRSAVEGGGSGVGAAYSWAGNDQVGEGRLTITECLPASLVAMRLEFEKPWRSTSLVRFRIAPEGDGSRVTWTMDGTNNYAAKVMSLFTSMDALIGRDFQTGLANLKQLCEEAPSAPLGATPDSAAADTTRATPSGTHVAAKR